MYISEVEIKGLRNFKDGWAVVSEEGYVCLVA